MNANILLFNKSYWDRIHESFEDYCYNYFDESHESQVHEFMLAINRIPVFVVFILVFHFQFLVSKSNLSDSTFTGNAKEIKLENQMAVLSLNEPETINENRIRTEEFPVHPAAAPILFSLSGIVRKRSIYSLNCAFIN